MPVVKVEWADTSEQEGWHLRNDPEGEALDSFEIRNGFLVLSFDGNKKFKYINLRFIRQFDYDDEVG